ALESTRQWWQDWAAQASGVTGQWSEATTRSLILLRAMTHAETGGLVAAATTSLPEAFGGGRNWDYRYVWLRDAALAIHVLITHGYLDASRHWRDWMLRAIAGDPEDLRIMYGIAGERNLAERQLPSLPGYDGATPVRIGNGAATQFQGDVIGEVMVAMRHARAAGVPATELSWALQKSLVEYLEAHFAERDRGIWEIRGAPQRFTHSRVMMWAAFDSAIEAVEVHDLDGPLAGWRARRQQLRDEIESMGYDEALDSYTQSYESSELDAALLQLPQVGYCAWDSPRMLSTVSRIEERLMDGGGLVRRYSSGSGVDGLVGVEHPFLACSFWLVEQYARSGRRDDAVRLMTTVTGLANEVGMLSEEYDVRHRRHAGNTPQMLSHLALIRAADALRDTEG
ncbi:MAG: glucoamylase, partial [Frankiales bacterium]|nr:glucoamylase [Frankiales bacterium]